MMNRSRVRILFVLYQLHSNFITLFSQMLSWYFNECMRNQLDGDYFDHERIESLVQTCALLFSTEIERRFKRHYLIRDDLHLADECAWRQLYSSYRDAAFLQTMNVDTTTFAMLLQQFMEHPAAVQMYGPVRSNRNRKGSGRKRMFQPYDHLAIVLHYLRSKATQSMLGMLFGMGQAQLSVYVRQGIIILLDQLRRHYDGRIMWPTLDEMKHFSDLAKNRDDSPDVAGVIGFLDGLKLPVKEPTDKVTQSSFYSGYKKRCEVTNVIFFTFDGCIAHASINYPGAISDSEMAQGIYRRLLSIPSHIPYKIIADSAFIGTGELETRILKPKSERQQISSIEEGISHARITSLRQGVEWGMRCIESKWTRLNTKLTLNNRRRSDIIELCLRLHNLITRNNLVSRNQIKTVFSLNYIPNILNFTTNPHQHLSQFYRLQRLSELEAANVAIDHEAHSDEEH